MKYIVSVAFWVVWAVSLPVVFALTLPVVLWLAAADGARRAIHTFNCRWAFSYLSLNPFWRVEVTGREKIPRGACVLVANHQSMVDVVACMGLKTQFKFVSKASLFNAPILGWMMRLAKYVSLERGKSRSMRQMLRECQRWLERGMPVLLFPEGTYGSGAELLPFKKGAFHLAVECQVPLVPVVLRGTTGLIVGDGPWLSPRCHITVTVQDPIPVHQLGSDAASLRQRVRERFEAALQKER